VSGELHTLANLPLEKNPSTQRIGGGVGPTTSQNVLEKNKRSCSTWDVKHCILKKNVDIDSCTHGSVVD
jgi:hypothetical protein